MADLTKEAIVELLRTSDKAVARALLVLNANQTDSEQTAETVLVHNGKGFRPCHARMGTSMAKFFQRNNYLSEKQIAYWRKVDKKGNMRIGIYSRQLLEAAAEKARQKAVDPEKELC